MLMRERWEISLGSIYAITDCWILPLQLVISLITLEGQRLSLWIISRRISLSQNFNRLKLIYLGRPAKGLWNYMMTNPLTTAVCFWTRPGWWNFPFAHCKGSRKLFHKHKSGQLTDFSSWGELARSPFLICLRFQGKENCFKWVRAKSIIPSALWIFLSTL